MASQTTPPYAAYAGIMSAYVGSLATAGAVAKLLDRDPREHSALDLALLGLATFKAARTVSRDGITSFLREPFVAGHANEGAEDPVETGDLRQALGELVTCSRCIGTWIAAGLAGTEIVAACAAPHSESTHTETRAVMLGIFMRLGATASVAPARRRKSLEILRMGCRGTRRGGR